MRSLTLLIFILGFCCQNSTLANTWPNTNKSDKYVFIPDENFEKALIRIGYDKKLNGKVLRKNISGIRILNVSDGNISDLTGVEGFTALERLYCNDNQLTRLDVSNNTALTELYCSDNQLTSLDVSNNTALIWLGCDNNQLTSLDVSKNPVIGGVYADETTNTIFYDDNLDSDEAGEVCDCVEDVPEYPGGEKARLEFLSKRCKYPEMAKSLGIQGKVFIVFTVTKKGKVKQVKVLKGVHETLDKEALRLIKAMPDWKPGKQKGEAVNCILTFPIHFKINN